MPQNPQDDEYSGSDAEYWKIAHDGTMSVVFRAPHFCKDCGNPRFVFRMRTGGQARCWECDVEVFAASQHE